MLCLPAGGRNLWHGHLTQAQGQDGHATLGHAVACPYGGPSVSGPSSVVLPLAVPPALPRFVYRRPGVRA